MSKIIDATDESLRQLNPDSETLSHYKNMEKSSLARINKILESDQTESDTIEWGKLLHKWVTAVNKIRTVLKGEVSMTLKLFHDVSKDKDELEAYVKATYPKMIK